MGSNITTTRAIKHYFLLLQGRITSLRRYQRTYQNSIRIIKSITRSQFPIDANLKNGKHVTLHNLNEAYAYTTGLNNYVKFENNNIVKILNQKLGPELTIKTTPDNGELMEVFFKEGYSRLPVKDRIVLDIGANIADTSIYFAIKGAKKVIALEPFPKNYEMAKQNVELNKLSEKIFLTLGGLSDKNSHMLIDSDKEGMFTLEHFEKGLEIPLITLDHILNINDVDSAILKMDCENCEYPSILNSSKDTLRKFTHIQIEYHNGYKNLKDKLESCGFKTSLISAFSKSNGKYLGYLYAVRK